MKISYNQIDALTFVNTVTGFLDQRNLPTEAEDELEVVYNLIDECNPFGKPKTVSPELLEKTEKLARFIPVLLGAPCAVLLSPSPWGWYGAAHRDGELYPVANNVKFPIGKLESFALIELS